MNSKGVNIIEVIKGKDSIKSGIDLVRAFFKANRLHIHKRCVNLIQELETYAYPEKLANRNESENPIKENDHAVDALRYLITSTQKMGAKTETQQRQEEQFQIRRNRQVMNSTR